MTDTWAVAGHTFTSRLIVGTGKYKDFEQNAAAVEASGAEIVTVAVRRVNISDPKQPMLVDFIDLGGGEYEPSAGDVFELFTGDVAGSFANVVLPDLPDHLLWDATSFADGVVEIAVVPPNADFDDDGYVNGTDFLTWQRRLGATNGGVERAGDADFDGVVDETLREGQFVAGANRTGYHLRGVEHGRDFAGRVADIRLAREGDRCPKCGGALTFRTAIEVGHIFKLGTFYSVPFDATYLDEQSVEHPMQMGCYGIGPGRVLAAVVEQCHDERGIVWPASVAPYDVHVLSLAGGSEEVAALATAVAEDLSEAGSDVLLDDRDERPGEKFADADLLGAPLRVTVGKKSLGDDAVDVRRRADATDTRVARSSVIDWTRQD